MAQKVIITNGDYSALDPWLMRRTLVVCESALAEHEIIRCLKKKEIHLGGKLFFFSAFSPNPLYEAVVNGVSFFRQNRCDAIIAIGGGSAIDVAKCIKLYSVQSGNGEHGEWLHQKLTLTNNIPFLVIPTTAGTGSEATKYSVIYFQGEKQSISENSIIPDTVILDSSILKTLPEYQRKATMCDALSHSLESFWSVNSTDESKMESRKALEAIIRNMTGYLNNTEVGNREMLLAAHMAGRAINITQTTAGHAMCYKLTSLFGLAHGHAAILCNLALFPWMINNLDRCIDPRGSKYLSKTLDEIGRAIGCKDASTGAKKLDEIVRGIGLDIPSVSEDELQALCTSVNTTRLKNHPIKLDIQALNLLYRSVVNVNKTTGL